MILVVCKNIRRLEYRTLKWRMVNFKKNIAQIINSPWKWDNCIVSPSSPRDVYFLILRWDFGICNFHDYLNSVLNTFWETFVQGGMRIVFLCLLFLVVHACQYASFFFLMLKKLYQKIVKKEFQLRGSQPSRKRTIPTGVYGKHLDQGVEGSISLHVVLSL